MHQFVIFVCALVIVPGLTDTIRSCPQCAKPPTGCQYLPGANGCQECKLVCAKPKCPPVCEIFCMYGNVLDANGCPTCRCKLPPRSTTTNQPFPECHKWMKCAQGLCPYACACKPNC